MVYCKCGFIDLAIFDMNSKKGDLNCKKPQNPTTGKRQTFISVESKTQVQIIKTTRWGEVRLNTQKNRKSVIAKLGNADTYINLTYGVDTRRYNRKH